MESVYTQTIRLVQRKATTYQPNCGYLSDALEHSVNDGRALDQPVRSDATAACTTRWVPGIPVGMERVS